MRKYDVYGIGAALVDTEIEVTDLDLANLGVEKGMMTLVDEARLNSLHEYLTTSDHLTVSRRACGGSAANTLIALSHFGASGSFSCQVANDENGQLYLDGLKEAGIHFPNSAPITEGHSGRCLVLITPDAERSMNTFLGASESFSEENIDYQVMADSEYFYIEGYLVTSDTGRAAASAARQAARKCNTRVAMSLSDPGIVAHFKEGLEAIIDGHLDLLFCNLEEALSWTGAKDLDTATEALTDIADRFVITLGAEGCLLFDGDEIHRLPGHQVTAVDTNGAGDMFAGAMLYGLSQNYAFKQAGQFACLASATVVSHFGPRLHPQQHHELLNEFKGQSASSSK